MAMAIGRTFPEASIPSPMVVQHAGEKELLWRSKMNTAIFSSTAPLVTFTAKCT
jgi:hypothetical protein